MRKKIVRVFVLVLVCALPSVLTGCFNGGGLGDGGGLLGFGLLGPGNAFGDIGPGGSGAF